MAPITLGCIFYQLLEKDQQFNNFFNLQILIERGEVDPAAGWVPPDDRLCVHVASDHLHVRSRSSGWQHGHSSQVSGLWLHISGVYCIQLLVVFFYISFEFFDKVHLLNLILMNYIKLFCFAKFKLFYVNWDGTI